MRTRSPLRTPPAQYETLNMNPEIWFSILNLAPVTGIGWTQNGAVDVGTNGYAYMMRPTSYKGKFNLFVQMNEGWNPGCNSSAPGYGMLFWDSNAKRWIGGVLSNTTTFIGGSLLAPWNLGPDETLSGACNATSVLPNMTACTARMHQFYSGCGLSTPRAGSLTGKGQIVMYSDFEGVEVYLLKEEIASSIIADLTYRIRCDLPITTFCCRYTGGAQFGLTNSLSLPAYMPPVERAVAAIPSISVTTVRTVRTSSSSAAPQPWP